MSRRHARSPGGWPGGVPMRPRARRRSKDGGTVICFRFSGIDDPANLDVERLWAPTRSGPPFEENPWGEQWLRIPYGRDEFGNPCTSTSRSPTRVGWVITWCWSAPPASGKSEFWTTLILAACCTHSPESLNIAFFDFKGATTAQAIEHLPHVVAAMNNLRDDSLWLERMADVLYGELEIRKQMLPGRGSATPRSMSICGFTGGSPCRRCRLCW